MTMTAPEDIDERLRLLAQKAFDASTRRGIVSLAAWTMYLNDVREVVNHFRGLEVADLLFLDGLLLRDIVDHFVDVTGENISHQTVAVWLNRYGPSRYLTVAEERGAHVLHHIPVLSTTQTRRELTALQELGRRVAPARWEVPDDVDPTALWNALAGASSRHSPAPAHIFNPRATTTKD